MSLRVVRRLARRLSGPRALVLMYHRVAALATDPWQLAVSPAHFAEHMAILRRSARVVSLAEVNDRQSRNAIREDIVAVTFDDGYADNLITALPILSENEIAATVFVATRAVLEAREFWWDQVENILLRKARLPAPLAVRLGSTSLDWNAGTVADAPFHDLCVRLRSVSPDLRAEALDQLRQWADVPEMPRATHRPLTPDEVAELSTSPLVEIGAHTVNHPALGHRPRDEQEREVGACRMTLQEITGRVIRQFAYPFGGVGLYSPASVEVVRTNGFACACTTTHGTVRNSSNAWELPRIHVPDINGERFAGLLADWVDVDAS